MGKIPHFDYSNMFQMGWRNHQPENPLTLHCAIGQAAGQMAYMAVWHLVANLGDKCVLSSVFSAWGCNDQLILFMEEILHHLGCIKLYRWWDIYHTNWCRISSINRKLVILGGLGGWLGILGVPPSNNPTGCSLSGRAGGVPERIKMCAPSNNPFHKGTPRIQTTNPKHPFTIDRNEFTHFLQARCCLL